MVNTISTDTKIDNKQETLADIIECIPILEKIAHPSELLAQLSEHQRNALITAAGKMPAHTKRTTAFHSTM